MRPDVRAPSANSPASSGGSSISLPRLLVVQASGQEPSALCELLRELAFDVVLASTGASALESMQTGGFSAVLIDRHLSDFGAIGVLRTARRLGIDVPVIVVAVEPTVDEVLELIRDGCADVLPHPLSLHDVAEAIDRVAPPDRGKGRARPFPPARRQLSRDPGSAPWPLSVLASGTQPAVVETGPESIGAPAAQEPEGRQPSSSEDKPRKAPRPKEASSSPSAPPPAKAPSRAKTPPPAKPPPPAKKEGASPPAVPDPRPQIRTSSSEREREVREAALRPRQKSVRKLAKAAEAKLRLRLDAADFELPGIGPVAVEVQRLLKEPNCSPLEVAKLISHEPAVVSSILRRANSSALCGGQEVTDLKTACKRLGNRRVLVLTQELLVRTAFDVPPGPLREILEAMWRNVVVTSRITRELSTDLGIGAPDEMEVAAMLHNVGELVLLRLAPELGLELEEPRLPDEFAAAVIKGHERAGRELMSAWRMPKDLILLAGSHHSRPLNPESRDQTARRRVIGLAWMSACLGGYTYLQGQTRLEPEGYLLKLGIAQERIDEMMESAPDWVAEAGA